MNSLIPPYKSSKIKTGYDLIRFYEKLLINFKKNPPEILNNSFNINIKFSKFENTNDYVVLGDHGKNNSMDIEGFDYEKLNHRFINNKNCIKAYKILFYIFDKAHNEIFQLLKQLKLFNDNNILNCSYIPEKNTIYFNNIYNSSNKKERIFTPVSYNDNSLIKLINILQFYAKEIGVIVSTPKKTAPLLDNVNNNIFNNILNTHFVINIKPNLAITKNLKSWLRGCKNPHNKNITINNRKTDVFDKSIYFNILNKFPLIDIIGKQNLYNHKKTIIDAFIMQLANQALGQALINSLKDDNNVDIRALKYKNFIINGDDIINKFGSIYEENNESINSYINNPPLRTSDWGVMTPMNESIDLEIVKNPRIFVNYIIPPRPFLKNDYELYKKLSSYFSNHIITICIPTTNDIKFKNIAKTINAFGIDNTEIEHIASKYVNPVDCTYGNANIDKVIYIITPESKKYLKYNKKYLKKYISDEKMLSMLKHGYYKIFDLPSLNILEYKKIKTFNDFIKKYAKSDDSERNQLLIAMYGNTNLKTLFNKLI